MKELAIIIPMYNEEEGAERCVTAVCEALDRSSPGARLFVVNDGSIDRTLEILTDLIARGLPFSLVNQQPNAGYGAALVAGMRAAETAGFSYGLVMDSDLTNDPGLIPAFAKVLKDGNYDLVKASRYIRGGGMKGVPFYRQLYTILGNRIASILFNMGIKDCTNGFHAVRLSMVTDGKFVERGFPFLLEELLHLKKKNVRATEIPYILTARDVGEGTSKFSYKPQVLWAYFRYALRAACL